MFSSIFRILIMASMLIAGPVLALGAIDVSVTTTSQELAQHQIDVAASDAAQAASLATAAGESPLQLAMLRAARDGVVDGRDGVRITVDRPPSGGKFAGRPTAIEVVIARTLPTSFVGSLLHQGGEKAASAISARAVIPLVWAPG